jgi:DNA-directed RNA polymerase
LREWSDELDTRKQSQAIIPNIIHSLDASHLMNVILTAKKQSISPVITVHDCYGTHPNLMGELEYSVKKEFVLLYTKNKFLSTFHKRVLQSIKDNNFKIVELNNKHYVELEATNKLLEIPILPKLGKLDLERIVDSKYMIN